MVMWIKWNSIAFRSSMDLSNLFKKKTIFCYIKTNAQDASNGVNYYPVYYCAKAKIRNSKLQLAPDLGHVITVLMSS